MFTTLLLEKALEKAPDNVSIYNSLGTAYMAIGKSEEAVNCYKKALELSPKSPIAYYNLGSAYQIQQNPVEACKYFKQAVELDEDDELLDELSEVGFSPACLSGCLLHPVKTKNVERTINIFL